MTSTPGLDADHPSFLAIDRAMLGQPSAELSAHLVNCAACRHYFDSLAEAPAAAGLLEVRRKLEQQRYAKRRSLWTAVPIATAAAALLFAGLSQRKEPIATGEPYVGAKGSPSVWIYVKRGVSTTLWDGRQPLLAGDQLRLKLDPGRFAWVTVFSGDDGRAPARLYTGPVIPQQHAILPDAWELDGEPGAERLIVVLSDGAVTPVWPDWSQGKAPPAVTVLPFVLPKSVSESP